MHDQFARGVILAVMIPALSVPAITGSQKVTHQKKQAYQQEQSIDALDMNRLDQTAKSNSSSKELTAKFKVDGRNRSVQVETYISNEPNKSAVVVTNAAKLTMYRCTFKKSGRTSNLNDSNLYGLNSVLCVNRSSSVKLTRGNLSSDAEGANAVISTGAKSQINMADVKISTTGNASKGLYATYGGIIYASKTNISTKGENSAPLATDKSGGTIRLTDGYLQASGKNSPCIYSGGNIIVKNVDGTSIASCAAVVEGKNMITLYNSNLIGSNGVTFVTNDTNDATVGTGIFTAKNSSIKATADGAMFYANTDAKVELTNTKLISSSGILAKSEGRKTPKGMVGGNLILRAADQIVKGSILCDKYSTVELRLADEAKFQGCTDPEHKGAVSIVLSADATWRLSGDSYVSSITDLDYELGNIQSLGYNIYYDSKNPTNSWLKGTTTELIGGGKMMPIPQEV